MTDHERYLVERMTVEVARLRETVEELIGNGRGPLAPHLVVSEHAARQLRQIADRLKERADEAARQEGEDAELAPRAQDRTATSASGDADARRAEDVAPYQRGETKEPAVRNIEGADARRGI